MPALNGNSKALQAHDGHVVLNLVPLLNESLKAVADVQRQLGRPPHHRRPARAL